MLRTVGVLVGFAYVTAIGAVGFATVTYVAPAVKSIVGDMQASSHAPVRRADLVRLLPGVPLYPNAQLNEATSNNPAFRLVKRTLGDESAEVLAFDCDDSLDRIIQWHRTHLHGWRPLEGLDDWRLPFDLPMRSVAFVQRTQLLVILPGVGRGGFGRNGYIIYVKGIRPPVDLARLAREVNQHPRDPRRRRNLASEYENESVKDYARALEQWHAYMPLAVGREPSDRPAVEFHIGFLLTRLRRNEEALAWFQKSAAHFMAADRREALSMGGEALVDMGRLQEAEEFLVNALGSRQMPGNAKLHRQLAMLYHSQGRLDDAVKEYETAQQQGALGVGINLARAELERGNEARARTLLIEAARRDRRFSAPFLEELRSTGRTSKPQRPWVGLQMTTVTAPWAHALRLPADNGVWLEEVIPGSPAYRAGLRRQDVVVIVEGEPYSEAEDLIHLLRSKHPGDELHLRVSRGGKTIETRLRLGSILER